MSHAPSRRILLVEDDEDTRQLLAVALGAQGYDVRNAGDAQEGLRFLGEGRFDMVMTDYDLPGKTGAAMLREAQRDGLLDGTATLVVTAHPDPDGVEDATVVRKPLDLEKFLLQVRRIFEEAAAPARPAEADPAAAVELSLYLSATSPASMKARRNMEKLLRRFPQGRVVFAVFDLAEDAARAESDKVVFTPTLVKREPEPRAWILGDLSDPGVVTDLLHMCGIDPLS